LAPPQSLGLIAATPVSKSALQTAPHPSPEQPPFSLAD
jgi:hypothetical protein